MTRFVIQFLALVLLGGGALPCQGGTPDAWYSIIYPTGPRVQGTSLGSLTGHRDGWDGQSPVLIQGAVASFLLLCRQNGASWSGPTGFYDEDFESPIPWGGSKTWPDIYLWAQNYSPPGSAVSVRVWPEAEAPAGYTGLLVLDYVPESLGWTGPWQFEIDMTVQTAITLPLPVATDPTDPAQVTRIHLTVYAIPEPSSLAGLGLAAAGLTAGSLRRRRRQGR